MNGHPHQQQPQGYYGDKPAHGPPNGMPHDHQQPYHHGPAHAYEHAGASKLPSKFQFSLFDCFSPFGTCCLSFWCPCVLFQRTYSRDRGERDPSGMGAMCVGHCILLCCGVSPILQCLNRGTMQEKYGMDSNICLNFGVACCCGCCQLVQEDKESIVRNTGMNPKTNQPYQPVGGMNYA